MQQNQATFFLALSRVIFTGRRDLESTLTVLYCTRTLYSTLVESGFKLMPQIEAVELLYSNECPHNTN